MKMGQDEHRKSEKELVDDKRSLKVYLNSLGRLPYACYVLMIIR